MQLNISFSFAGSSSLDFTRPVQQITILDYTNPQFLRQVFLSQDGLQIVRGKSVSAFPMSNFFAVAAAADPSLSWPPKFITNLTRSVILNPGSTPNTASLFVSASSEFTNITYQWYIQPSGGLFSPTTNSGDWHFQGTSSAALTASCFIGAANHPYWNFECVATNQSGQTTSSVCQATTVSF